MFYEDPTINVAATVLTRQIFMKHNGRQTVNKRLFTPPGGHVFPLIMTIFELVRDIYKIDAKNVTSRVQMTRQIQKTHVLTKFHEDWTKNVTSRVFTCFHYIHIEKTAPPPGGHFHNDWAKIVTSRVFTRNTVFDNQNN
ncbi:hypothetical protein DPMN_009540 [Dreissena polymorpha]|uniref:Uncharacterized protein n=1 Tax=Dreissena polymorpha TaxID=45954 RepID=A0A9D4MY93_DREPO|nr:hypothetical protein DPMN_009540 [Dreissena polymorpha]